MDINTLVPGNAGFIVKDIEIHLIAHAAITAGLIYTVDMGTATAANHGVATTSAAVSVATKEEKLHVLATEAIASGETGRFLIAGYADALAGGTTISAETAVTSGSAGSLIAAAVGYRTLGLAPEAITNATTGKIWFDGRGIGVTHSVID